MYSSAWFLFLIAILTTVVWVQDGCHAKEHLPASSRKAFLKVVFPFTTAIYISAIPQQPDAPRLSTEYDGSSSGVSAMKSDVYQLEMSLQSTPDFGTDVPRLDPTQRSAIAQHQQPLKSIRNSNRYSQLAKAKHGCQGCGKRPLLRGLSGQSGQDLNRSPFQGQNGQYLNGSPFQGQNGQYLNRSPFQGQNGQYLNRSPFQGQNGQYLNRSPLGGQNGLDINGSPFQNPGSGNSQRTGYSKNPLRQGKGMSREMAYAKMMQRYPRRFQLGGSSGQSQGRFRGFAENDEENGKSNRGTSKFNGTGQEEHEQFHNVDGGNSHNEWSLIGGVPGRQGNLDFTSNKETPPHITHDDILGLRTEPQKMTTQLLQAVKLSPGRDHGYPKGRRAKRRNEQVPMCENVPSLSKLRDQMLSNMPEPSNEINGRQKRVKYIKNPYDRIIAREMKRRREERERSMAKVRLIVKTLCDILKKRLTNAAQVKFSRFI